MPGHETVFISYRREDSAVQAEQLRHSLATMLHQETVFFDQAMRPGTDFPNEIAAAIGRAKAVLVVIGPGWLDAMKARASKPDRTDWVLEEVQAALERRDGNEKFLVIPMLLPGATLPAENEPSLPPALKALWRVNAQHLKEQSRALASSSEDYALLALLMDAGVRRFMGADDAEVLLALKALGDKVKALRTQTHMKAISDAWVNPPDTPSTGTDIYEAIVGLANAIRACSAPLRQLEPKPKAETRATCQSLLTLLITMTTDFALAEQWQLSGGRWVVPARHPGHAISVAAAHINAKAAVATAKNEMLAVLAPPVLLEPDAAQHPSYARTFELGVAGVDVDATDHMYASVWHLLMPNLRRDYPVDKKQAIEPTSDGFKALRGAVVTARKEHSPVVVTHQQTTAAPDQMPACDDAARLGVDYLAHGPECAVSLSRFDSDQVNAARLSCQNAINDILAT